MRANRDPTFKRLPSSHKPYGRRLSGVRCFVRSQLQSVFSGWQGAIGDVPSSLATLIVRLWQHPSSLDCREKASRSLLTVRGMMHEQFLISLGERFTEADEGRELKGMHPDGKLSDTQVRAADRSGYAPARAHGTKRSLPAVDLATNHVCATRRMLWRPRS
jgi:hypothetical protein